MGALAVVEPQNEVLVALTRAGVAGVFGRRAAAVGEEIASEDEVVLVVFDEEDAYGAIGCVTQCESIRLLGGSSTISIQ